MDRTFDCKRNISSTHRNLTKGHRSLQNPNPERHSRGRGRQSLGYIDRNSRSQPSNLEPPPPYQSRLTRQNISSPMSGLGQSLTANSRIAPQSNLPNQRMPSRQPSSGSMAAKTTLRSGHDQKMASRQPQIDSLPPKERQEQEAWAQSQLKLNSGTCVVGFSWYRIDGGYRCYGGRHMVTDELLAEGKGGCYSSNYGIEMRNNPAWEGPFYGREIADHMLGFDRSMGRGLRGGFGGGTSNGLRPHRAGGIERRRLPIDECNLI